MPRLILLFAVLTMLLPGMVLAQSDSDDDACIADLAKAIQLLADAQTQLIDGNRDIVSSQVVSAQVLLDTVLARCTETTTDMDAAPEMAASNTPETAVDDYFNAFFDGDIDRLRQLTCSQYDGIYDDPAVVAALNELSAATEMADEFSISLDLEYDVEIDGDSATVTVSGGSITMSLTMQEQSFSQEMDAEEMGGGEATAEMLREGDTWTICDPSLIESFAF